MAEQSKEKIVLTERQTELLETEKQFFGRIVKSLETFGLAPEDKTLLVKVSQGLDALFMLVVVGEFNSGKSAFINALLGRKVLAEGVTPTTSQINILRHGEAHGQQQLERELLEVTDPAPFLQEISIVDTPGTNAIIERHQTLTEEFVPRSDLVLFITSSERPFTESERQFLEKVTNWGKKIVVVVNKTDLLRDREDIQQVVKFVADGFRERLGIEPPIFPIAGKLAYEAKTTATGQDAIKMWQRSGFGELENYIFNTLDQTSRIRLKMLSPLNVLDKLLTKYHTTTQDRLKLLEQDARTVDDIEKQLALYQEDMRRDFDGRQARLHNLLNDLNERADSFFDDTLKVTRILELARNTDRLKADFEQRVIADTPRRLEAAVTDMVEWMVERESRTWQEINRYLQERRQVGGDANMLGRADNAFERFNYNRRMLLQQTGEQARLVLQGFDQRAEAEKLNQQVKEAISRTALAELGAVGLGAGLLVILGTLALDVTGIFIALAAGGAGLYILPAKKRKAKYDFRHRIETLRGQLTSVLREQFENELVASVERVREAIAPYTHFIRTERERLTVLDKEYGTLRREMTNLQTAIETATAPKQGRPLTLQK
jgi:small GTP-binding protein